MAAAAALFAASAGLDLVSGVMGYLASKDMASIAYSRADMIRGEAEANAQRYAEKATADRAQQKVMFLASGVTLQGSPIDVLDKSAQLASENIAAIRMQGAAEALDMEQQGKQAEIAGRNALIGGLTGGLAKGTQAAAVGGGSSPMAPKAASAAASTGFGYTSRAPMEMAN